MSDHRRFPRPSPALWRALSPSHNFYPKRLRSFGRPPGILNTSTRIPTARSTASCPAISPPFLQPRCRSTRQASYPGKGQDRISWFVKKTPTSGMRPVTWIVPCSAKTFPASAHPALSEQHSHPGVSPTGFRFHAPNPGFRCRVSMGYSDDSEAIPRRGMWAIMPGAPNASHRSCRPCADTGTVFGGLIALPERAEWPGI